MKADAVVVIPYYHSDLSEFEQVSFQNCLEILNQYSIALVVPEGMPASEYPAAEGLLFIPVPDAWLVSVASYNRMMMSEEFYQRFIQYEYMLIFQLDAFVFSDSLARFCSYGYDYIGAPWLKGWPYLKDLKKGVWHVGNGGFSLRKVSSFLNVLKEQPIKWNEGHEDLFWASRDSEDFHVAPLEIALEFAFEQDVRQCFALNQNRLPFGCHAWEKYDFEFWRPVFEQKGYYFTNRTTEEIDKKNHYQRSHAYYLEADQIVIKSCLAKLTQGRTSSICIFGAGEKGKECGWLLRHAGMEDILYVDNNPQIWGNRVWDIAIEPPDILRKERQTNIFVIISVNRLQTENDILRQLEEWGYQYGRDMISYRCLIESITNDMLERK